jgi:hypothetical protein
VDRPITPSPATTIQPSASATNLPPDKLTKLQDTLRDLQECRELLDAAMTAET